MPKVTPKGLLNGAPGAHFDDFLCKKPTLHATAYLLCFRHILQVLGSPVLTKFLLKMCVAFRSPKKAATFVLFLILLLKRVKMGAQMGGGKSPKNRFFFSHCGATRGYPVSLGIIFAPRASFWHPFWVPLGSFLLNFEVPGHHFGTLGPHQNDAQAVQNSVKMQPK